MVLPSGHKSFSAIGFLTVVRAPDGAFFGGYLLLDALGRPLEFHCTAPVRPNRAQQILYGPALEPYLCGDRIGQTLLKAVKRTPSLAITDTPSVMGARNAVSHPLALFLGKQDPEPADPMPSGRSSGQLASQQASRTWRLDGPHGTVAFGSARLERFELERYQLAVVADYGSDRQTWMQMAPALLEQLDLEEPFGRIRQAIEEARKGAHAAG